MFSDAIKRLKLLTTNDAAAKLGMDRHAVIANIKRGSLRAHKIGDHWLILPEDLQSFIRDRKRRWGRVKMHAGSMGRPKRAPFRRRG
jgi:excisionase family DNA binding protein